MYNEYLQDAVPEPIEQPPENRTPAAGTSGGGLLQLLADRLGGAKLVPVIRWESAGHRSAYYHRRPAPARHIAGAHSIPCARIRAHAAPVRLA